MLPIDEQLYDLTKGQAGYALANAMTYLAFDTTPIWGSVLPLNTIVVEEERALQLVKSYLIEDVIAFSDEEPAVKQILEHYLTDDGSMLRQYIKLHPLATVETLLKFSPLSPTEVHPVSTTPIAIHQIGQEWLVHAFLADDALFWQELYARKIYSLLLQVDIEEISHFTTVMTQFHQALLATQTKNRAATIFHQLTASITKSSVRSYALKELHIQDVIIHFTSGRRHLRKIRKRIAGLTNIWQEGPLALTTKEQTLCAYLLLEDAVLRKDDEAILQQGLYLLDNDLLHNHIVELIVEHGQAMRKGAPNRASLIKLYDYSCMEFVFYHVMRTLVKKGEFQHAMQLMEEDELASCTAIYRYLNNERQEDMLYELEASVQVAIATIVDGSLQNVRQSLRKWQHHLQAKDSPYAKLARQSSQHVCHLLQVLWMNEQYELFERLIIIYKKYVYIEVDFLRLRTFITATVELE